MFCYHCSQILCFFSRRSYQALLTYIAKSFAFISIYYSYYSYQGQVISLPSTSSQKIGNCSFSYIDFSQWKMSVSIFLRWAFVKLEREDAFDDPSLSKQVILYFIGRFGCSLSASFGRRTDLFFLYPFISAFNAYFACGSIQFVSFFPLFF